MARGAEHPYCYPGTAVYRNLEGITDRGELDEFERILSATRMGTLPEGSR